MKCFNKGLCIKLHHYGFSLAEVLITLSIIGVVAAMIIPPLLQSYQERLIISRLLKFNSTLQQAVQLWKTDIGCYSDAYACLVSQNLPDNNIGNFDQIKKFMPIVQKAPNGYTNNESWLPDDTLNYYGNSPNSHYGKVANKGSGCGIFLLQDGTTFSMDVDPAEFVITVDVNGKQPPNRVGKDTFHFVIGAASGKDIYYFPLWHSVDDNANNLCPLTSACDANNLDPTVGNGASPTAYVLLNHKLPDFKALSETVSGFQP